MSWADDIRCLYCDGKLPLYRKLTNGQFCSAAHRKSYWLHQEALAVERLHQTHNSLRACQPKPTEKTQPEIVADAFEPPPMATAFAAFTVPRADDSPRLIAADPFEYEWVRTAEPPSIGLPVFSQKFPEIGGVSAADLRVLSPAPAIAAPLNLAPIAGPVDLSSAVSPDTPPGMMGLLAIRPSAPRDMATPARIDAPAPEAILLHPVIALEAHVDIEAPAVRVPGLTQVRFDRLAGESYKLFHIACLTNLDASLRVARFERQVQPREAKPHLAGGCRYAIALGTHRETLTGAPEWAYRTSAAALPKPPTPHPAEPALGQKCGIVWATSPASPAPQPNIVKAFQIVQPFSIAPILPISRLEPMNLPYDADLPAEARVQPTPAGVFPPVEKSGSKLPEWAHVRGFWKNAPRDLKVLLFAIPLLLSLALHPSLPKVRMSSPTGGALGKNVEQVWNTQMVAMRQTLTDRAGVELDEDFRTGLDDWTSRGQAATEWSFDATGFVQPSTLALYQPSLGLSDYQFQFLGMIDKKALSWVVRAADFNNYYVVKLVILKGGPLPTVGVTRYAVIDGKATERADTIVPVDAREDTLYRVRMDVHDNTYSLTVQGQMVDTWSNDQLKRGGIGFFCGKGEASRVRWVQLTHQYDMLGRLCAYLAPYNPSMNGSWQ